MPGLTDMASMKIPDAGRTGPRATGQYRERFPPPCIAGSVLLAPDNSIGMSAMLSWVVTFLIIALIAGLLGFGGIAGLSLEIAKIIFFVAILLFVIAVVFGAIGRRTVP
jgi:uncharacterized membrane protein YtjA (UPF0391 family)